MRLDKLQLSILDAFVPNLGISGEASGALDFTQARDASFPAAEARLTVANFRRTGWPQCRRRWTSCSRAVWSPMAARRAR